MAALLGLALGGPRFTITPASVSFEPAEPGVTNALSLGVTNDGDLPAGPLKAVLTGGDAAHFQIRRDECHGESLLQTQSCTIEVAYTPRTLGRKRASLRVSSDRGAAGEAVLSGSSAPIGGGLSALSITAPREAFGVTPIGADSKATFTVTNESDADTTLLGATVTQTPALGEFSIVESACSGLLNPGRTCAVTIGFMPRTFVVPRSATLEVRAQPGAPATRVLRPKPPTAPMLALQPAARDFGSMSAWIPSAPTEFIVSNPAGSMAGDVEVALVGADAVHFEIVDDQCRGQPLVGLCRATVRFAPRSKGAKAATFVVTAAGYDVLRAALTGSGT